MYLSNNDNNVWKDKMSIKVPSLKLKTKLLILEINLFDFYEILIPHVPVEISQEPWEQEPQDQGKENKKPWARCSQQ